MSDEFLINSYAGQWQESPDVARLKDGGYVVVWDSFFSEEDTDLYYVAGQRFSATGQKIGGEFIVDDDLLVNGGASTRPTVTALKDGGFAVAWENSPDGILGVPDVYARAYDADGAERGAIVRAHGPSGDDQQAPEISATKDGYLVSFTSESTSNPWNDVYFQRFDNDGGLVGSGSRINNLTKFDQQSAQSAGLSNGDTIVIWDSEYGGKNIPGAAGDHGVKGRIIGSDGKPSGKEFMISDSNGHISSAIEQDTSIDVAALKKGRFVASWYETVLHKNADTTFEIHARIFDKDGDAVGKEITVRADSEGVPRHSAVVGLDNGGFVVAWDEPGKDVIDEFQEAYARVYDKSGQAVGKAFKVHPESGQSDQEFPELAPFGKKGFFAVYESEYLDGDDDAIAGRIFEFGTRAADDVATQSSSAYRGFGGDDRVTGAGGDETLVGGGGSDRLSGEAGDDLLIGGAGADWLAGAEGADVFAFKRVSDSSANAFDRITDFDAGLDRIDLSRIDAVVDRGGDQAFRFVGDRAFSGTSGELRFEAGRLLGDVDGDGRADLRIDVGAVSKDALIL